MSRRLPLHLPVRLVRRGVLLLVLTAAAYAWVEVASYESTYSDAASRAQIQQLGDTGAVRVLQGEPRAVDTVGGFVVWDAGWFLALVVSVWAVLATTRLARGEEDDGRADVVLSRPVLRRDLLLAQLAAVGGGAVAFGAAASAALLALGLPAGGSLLFGAGLAGAGLTSAATGALAAQLLDVRRRAVAAGIAVVGAGYALRMVAHSADSRAGLLWATPAGWPDQLHAFSGDRWWALAPLLVTPAVLTVLAVRERERRDTGGARLAGRDRHEPRLRLLGGAASFGWRQSSGVLVAWCVGSALFGVVLGAMLPAVVDLLAEDGEYRQTLEDFGLDVSNPLDSFLAVLAASLALAFALYAAWRVGGLRQEESSGRLEHLLVRPLVRWRWLGSASLLGAAAALLVVLSSGIGIWIGGTVAGADLEVRQALEPVLATLPLVLLFLGLAVLAFGVVPRLTVALPVTLAVAAYALQLLGQALGLPGAVVDVSPFSWLPLPPEQPFSAPAAAVMLGIGVVAAAAGTWRFSGRDVGVG